MQNLRMCQAEALPYDSGKAQCQTWPPWPSACRLCHLAHRPAWPCLQASAGADLLCWPAAGAQRMDFLYHKKALFTLHRKEDGKVPQDLQVQFLAYEHPCILACRLVLGASSGSQKGQIGPFQHDTPDLATVMLLHSGS